MSVIKFKSMFDMRDKDDVNYFTNIPLCDPLPLLQHLQEWVQLIRTHRFSLKDFAKFKFDVLSDNLPDFVVWNAKSLCSEAPFVMFDLNWKNLNSAVDVYLAYMMIENTSVLLPTLNCSLWSVIDIEITKNKTKNLV